MTRAQELEPLEKEAAAARHTTVAELTSSKRLLLTWMRFHCLNKVPPWLGRWRHLQRLKLSSSLVWPQLRSWKQMQCEEISLCCSWHALLARRRLTFSFLRRQSQSEVERGWAEGPIDPNTLEPPGATISRRFPLVQTSKTWMIDDFSVSGVNDSCVAHNRVDFHLFDTFCAMVKAFFGQCAAANKDSELRAKTYDLTSAYRQVPIKPDHYKYAYVCIYNCKKGCAEIYKMKTMLFGATHSVYCFLRLARCLYSLATRGLHLLITNFYDDFFFAAKPGLCESSKNSMELLFMLTGWLYARDGKKSTAFASHCRALGVEFDFSRSEQRLMAVANTVGLNWLDRSQKLWIAATWTSKHVSCSEDVLALQIVFLHGRIGKLVLKKFIDHAYGKNSRMDEELCLALIAMRVRLQSAGPKVVSANSFSQWFIFSDACFEPSLGTGGLGGVLVNAEAQVCAWFGIPLDAAVCVSLGSHEKTTIIYELELLAAVMSLTLWSGTHGDELNVHFGDTDGVRFFLVKATAAGSVGQKLMAYHVKQEALKGSRTWFARVPTECNISDYPSRGEPHALLCDNCNGSSSASDMLNEVLAFLNNGGISQFAEWGR